MNKEILKKVLSVSSIEFSYEEIQNLLDEELAKEPEEMDTELVELCIEVLSKKTEADSIENNEAETNTDVPIQQVNKAHKKKSVKKLFLIAAIVAVTVLISISVSANIFKNELPEGMVRIGNDKILLDLTKIENTLPESELDALYKFQDVLLLPVFSEAKCDMTILPDNETVNVSFEFKKLGVNGYIDIKDSYAFNSMLKHTVINLDVEQMKQISINGINAVVVSTTASNVSVLYNLGDKLYNIKFYEMNIEDVVNLLNN